MPGPDQFDVFVAYNSVDGDAVRRLGKTLEARGIRVWCDLWEAPPGRPWWNAVERAIQTCKCAIATVGPDGIGPWEHLEVRACLSEFVEDGKPLIPVLLPGAPQQPELPILWKGFVWVDLRDGFTREGIDRLEWGITGHRSASRAVRRIEPLLKPPPAVSSVDMTSYASALLCANDIAEAARDAKGLPEDVRQRISKLPELRVDWDSFEFDRYDVIFRMWLKDMARRDTEVWARVGTLATKEHAKSLGQKLLQAVARLAGGGKAPAGKLPTPLSKARSVLVIVVVGGTPVLLALVAWLVTVIRESHQQKAKIVEILERITEAINLLQKISEGA